MRVVDIVPPKPSDDELDMKTATALIVLGFILGFTISAYAFLEVEDVSKEAIIAIEEQFRLVNKIMPVFFLIVALFVVFMSWIIYTGGVGVGD
ncbi:hypothetical protein [Geoglobus ahangari]